MTLRRPLRRLFATSGLALALALPVRTHAWDPSTTHVGMVERAAIEGDLHTRWMESSARTRGLFTPLRIDPAALDPNTRRRLELALRRAHADAGAVPLGGPGSCPPIGSPPSTRARCVEGDLWEATALGWIRLGIALEVAPPVRLLHHFVDGREPARSRWRAPKKLARAWLRRVELRAGGTVAALVGRSGFAGTGESAIAWLDDRRDPFAPPAMRDELRRASLAETPALRDHHLALALVGVGALLHVVQDTSVPAHARGDIAAMFMPLSPAPGDRGSPLAEYARLTFGRRGLPRPVELGTRAGEPKAKAVDVRALVLGGAHGEGLVELAGRRFFAEGTLPAPRVIADALDGGAAAAALCDDLEIPLDPVEIEGATLAPWPAESGYLLSSAGRPLAAWRRDETGLVEPYLDVHVLRSQALVLLPAAVEATTAVLDLLWPAWPDDAHDAGANIYEIDTPAGLGGAEIIVLAQDAAGVRTPVRRVRLRPRGRSRIRDIVPATLAKDGHVVLLLEGRRPDGSMLVLERRLDAERAPQIVTPLPGADAPPVPEPADETDPTDTDPTLPIEPPPSTEPPAGPVVPAEPEAERPDGDAIPGNRAAPPNPGTPSTPPPSSPSTRQPMPETPPDPVNPPKE